MSGLLPLPAPMRSELSLKDMYFKHVQINHRHKVAEED
jgi:hypothetical protein